ncbi:MAG: S41 family peptidase [Bacteroidales bacterium]|nr:S41 family peptidase [Bacteroidales bacterium]
MNKISFRVVLVFVLLTAFNFVRAQDENNFELSKNIEIYIDVLRQLNLNYADDINPGDLNKTAIDAMLSKLDPYTVYIPESQIEDFELMTKGEYGGIGSLIQKQDEYVVITDPYEGFPAQKAGLKPGDKIIEVDGESAVGKNSSVVSEKLKGIPGTSLNITVQPYGDTINKQVEIIREKVKIPNIPYYGMISESIGYIALSQFNPNAAAEVKKAFLDLQSNNNLQGIVIDLRGNGGGLLSEAVGIVNIFVPKGQTVVTTKGKINAEAMVHRTRNSAVNTKIPLVVAVNSNSASASEIVAGAIQDLDRGVIIGERTFGKGLVQNVLPLPFNAKLKVTIAKYYIPSGRCIQAIDYFHENGNSKAAIVPDSLISAFKTKAGRTVYDGGGIEPDIQAERKDFSQITADLYAGNYIFNYANHFALEHQEILPPGQFEIDETTFEDFKKFITDQDFDYSTETESLLEDLKGSTKREKYYDALKEQLDELELVLVEEKKQDIDKYKDEIKEMLLVEIVSRYYYQKGRIEVALKDDPVTAKAVEFLNKPAKYVSLLKVSNPKNRND